MVEYLHTALEIFVGFLALFILTKVLGKTQITQITAFDFISALVLGELVGNALYDQKTHIGKIIFAIFLWGVLIYAIEVITQKFKRSRKVLEGEPSIIIKNGRIELEALKKNMLDINQLQHLLRSKDVFSIQDVEFAILETDGTVSVLKKIEQQTPSRSDFNLPSKKVVLPYTIILDGELVRDNLVQSGNNDDWLNSQLLANGISKVSEVLYAEWREGEALFVMPY